MKLGYARVSTEDQDLSLQVNALKAAGCANVFSDQGISGAETCRDGLNGVLAMMQPGDTLVVWKLDRLGRSLRMVLDLIEQFQSVGCGFVSLTEGFDIRTNTGKLVCQILAAVAEFERGLAVERTMAGLAVARRAGKKSGPRFRLDEATIIAAHRLITAGDRQIIEMARELDVSYDTLRRGFQRLKLAA